MEFHSFADNDRITGFAFLRGAQAGQFAISDSVTLYRRSGQHAITGWCGRDIGFPVMHTTSLHVSHQIPQALLDGEEGRAVLTELLCACALSIAAGRPLVETTDPITTDSQAMDEFKDLFPELAASTENPAGHGDTSHYIPLAPELIDFGLETGLITRFDGGLRPAEPLLAIEKGKDCCSLQANARLRTIMERNGLEAVQPGAKLDLAAAAQALHSVTNLKPSTVWFYGHGDHPAQAYRLQAAAAYPLLAELLAETPELASAIDSCAPLGPAITERTGLKAAKLKRLARIDLEDALADEGRVADEDMNPTAVRGSDLTKLLGICRRVDSGWVPNDADNWLRLRDLHACLAEPLALRYEQDAVDLLVPAKGHWSAYAGKLADRVDVERDHFDGRAMQIVGDEIVSFVDDFLYSVLLPQHLYPILHRGDALPYPAADLLIEAGRTSFEMLSEAGNDHIGLLIRHARRWQNRIQSLYALEQQSQQVRDNDDEKRIRTCKSWPALASDFKTSAGYVIRCLNTVAGLKEESRRLNHCVGSLYITPARHGNVHLFSIQNAEGDCSYSTFEAGRPRSDVSRQAMQEIAIVQHKADSNRKPGVNLRAALAEWVKAVRSGTLDLNLREVTDWYERARNVRTVPSSYDSSRISPKAAWGSILSASWSDPAISALIREEWYRHILPRQFVSPDQLRVDKRVLALGL